MMTGETKTKTMTGTMTMSSLTFSGELRVTSVDKRDGGDEVEQIGLYVSESGGIGITRQDLLHFYEENPKRHITVTLEPVN